MLTYYSIQHLEYNRLLVSFPIGINCGLLDDPKNGTISFSNIGEEVVATYSCKPGYVLEPEGENIRVCTCSGNWTGSVPECRSKYYNIFYIPYFLDYFPWVLFRQYLPVGTVLGWEQNKGGFN